MRSSSRRSSSDSSRTRPDRQTDPVKPFVLLATRAEDQPADEEYALFLRYSGLSADQLVRVRLEAGPMPELDLDELSGIFVGGGPFNASDPPEKKSSVQHRVEAEFAALLDDVVARDFPFLGACYGVGTVGTYLGARIDRTYSEAISVVPVTLTDAGAADPLLDAIPRSFGAFVGVKDAPVLAIDVEMTEVAALGVAGHGELLVASELVAEHHHAAVVLKSP